MLAIIAVVLGSVIIVSAISADRSARARHPFRAIALNLCGIGCLALGLFSVFAWSHRGIDRNIQVAVATSPDSDRAAVVRLLVGSDGHLRHPGAVESEATLSEAVVVEVGRAEDGAEDAEEAAETGVLRIELPAEDPGTLEDESNSAGLDQLEEEGAELALSDPELGKGVEIDFAARPDWVDQPDRDVGELHLMSVDSSQPHRRVREAREDLYEQIKAATDEYINDFVGHPYAARWVGFREDEIRQRFLAPDRLFDEKVISPSFGVMHQSHALLEYGPGFHNEVEQAWHQVMARAQLVKVTLASGAVLGMLVLLLGYFRADSATRGFYSGRLKFVTGLAILAVIATGLLIAKSIPWLWL